MPGAPRGVGYVEQGPLFRFDGTFEALDTYDPWYVEPLASAPVFIDYLARQRIDYVIMPNANNKSYAKPIASAVTEAVVTLSTKPGVRIVEDHDYVFYDLAALHAAERSER